LNLSPPEQLFRTSLWHLPLLLALMALHKIDKEEEPVAAEPVTGEAEAATFMGITIPQACTRYSIAEIANGPGK